MFANVSNNMRKYGLLFMVFTGLTGAYTNREGAQREWDWMNNTPNTPIKKKKTQQQHRSEQDEE